MACPYFRGFALIQWNRARIQKDKAIKAEKEAVAEKEISDSLRGEAVSLLESLKIAKNEADSNAILAQLARDTALFNEKRAIAGEFRAIKAEKKAKAEREKALNEAAAYRLLVMAVNQQKLGNTKRAFLVVQLAKKVFPDIKSDSALIFFRTAAEFIRNTYNALEENTTVQRLTGNGDLLDMQVIDSETFVSVHQKSVSFWNVNSSSSRINIPGNSIKHVCLDSNSEYLAIADGKQVHIRKKPFDKNIQTLSFSQPVLYVRPTSQQVITSDASQHIRIWSLSSGKEESSTQTKAGVKGLAVDEKLGKIFAGDADGNLYIWTLSGQQTFTQKFRFGIQQMIYAPDRRQLLFSTIDERVILFDVTRNRVLADVSHRGSVRDIGFAKNPSQFYSASNDENAILWDQNGNKIKQFSHYIDQNSTAYVEMLAASPVYHELATATSNKEVFLWDNLGEKIGNYRFPQNIKSLDYSPDGKHLLIGLEDGTLNVYPTYQELVSRLGTLDWIEIDQLGFEMPLRYWLNENNPDQLKAYANHFAEKSDNFKDPPGHVHVLSVAAVLYEKWLTFTSRSALSASDQDRLVQVYGNLAWNQIKTGAFKDAISSSRKGIAIQPEKKWQQTNLALAYVMSGQFSKARPIYLQLKDAINDASTYDRRTLREVFLADITELEAEGITHPDFDKVRKLLAK